MAFSPRSSFSDSSESQASAPATPSPTPAVNEMSEYVEYGDEWFNAGPASFPSHETDPSTQQPPAAQALVQTMDPADLLLSNLAVSPPSKPTNNTEVSPPSPPAREDQIFWPPIAAYLANPSGPRPLVTCTFCTDEIIIPGLQPALSEDDDRETHLRLMPCQHVVGRRCWATYVRILAGDGQLPTCPYCKGLVDEDGNPRVVVRRRRRDGDGDGARGRRGSERRRRNAVY